MSWFSMPVHQCYFFTVIANMNILMKSMGWELNVTQVVFRKLRLFLIPMYIICSFLPFPAELLFNSSHVLLPFVPHKNATKFVRKDLPFVKLAWLSFISSCLSGCLVTSFLLPVSDLAYSQVQSCSFIIACFLYSSSLTACLGEVFVF